MFPNFNEERKLGRKGHNRVVGLDEVGRGSLAGPVMAAAVMIKLIRGRFVQIRGIKDSKKLSPKKREELYKLIIKNPQIKWGIGRVSERVIDKINILEATKLAMERAVKKLEKKLKKKTDFLILDGRMRINLDTPQKSIIKADDKVISCSMASIIAKVTRDKIMQRYSKKYPPYGFFNHKGYATRLHLEALKKKGPCRIHRKSFKPILSI